MRYDLQYLIDFTIEIMTLLGTACATSLEKEAAQVQEQDWAPDKRVSWGNSVEQHTHAPSFLTCTLVIVVCSGQKVDGLCGCSRLVVVESFVVVTSVYLSYVYMDLP